MATILRTVCASRITLATRLLLAGLAFTLGNSSAVASGPDNCTIQLISTEVTEGEPVFFRGTWENGDRPFRVDWSFEDGDPASDQQSGIRRPLVSEASTTFTSPGDKAVSMTVRDEDRRSCRDTLTVSVQSAGGGGGDIPPPPDIGLDIPQTDFKILMNYELGMHCTGFEFAYCCVLPAYNSILAQVVKPNTRDPDHGGDFARLLEGDPMENKDFLERQTVLRDLELDGNQEFKKYVLKYWHDAQPRNNTIRGELSGKVQTSTLISAVEGNSLLSWNTTVDAGANADNSLNYNTYNGVFSALVGDGIPDPDIDNYQNAVWNHLYVYIDPDTGKPSLEGKGGAPVNPGDESGKFRLGLGIKGVVSLPFPVDCGPAFHPMGPETQNGDPAANPEPVANDCGGIAKGNLLTYSGEDGTIVYTQMKLVENLPIMLTSPRIWEALGLPLTPFEDSIDFFADPGLVDEDSIRPYVAMKARLYNYDANQSDGVGSVVFDRLGHAVTGFGTAPIDIPNCERCHAAPPVDPDTGLANENSPNYDFPGRYDPGIVDAAALWAQTEVEYDYWLTLFPTMDPATGGSDWYARLKSAAINMLKLHDLEHGTGFADAYPGAEIDGVLPQNTRLGHESIICQKCHADNVIAVVKSACMGGPCGLLPDENTIKPITEAIHWNHRNISEGGTIAMHDSHGRDGGCQGCHPAHRSDGDMEGYPITKGGDNFYADSDNRLANGGCFVGRDVHSNPMKDVDGAGTPSHLNAVGQWLAGEAVAQDQGDWRGIWCTNCHSQLSQELWKADNCQDLINGICTDFDGNPVTNLRNASLQEIANAVAGGDLDKVKSWLDPKVSGSADGVDRTHEIWDASGEDALVAVIEVNSAGIVFNTDDDDGDRVNILSFCTTQTCLDDINDGSPEWNYKVNDLIDATERTVIGAAVPFGAATDGRDHWLSPGEPHCADCHTAPYVEQSGDHNPFPPFNYPRKASLMRYSRGHQDITCQGCHESIHGLYPVTATIDTTSYAQAAALNHDGSHGPLKCGTCHEVSGDGLPTWIEDLAYNGQQLKEINGQAARFDAAVSWAHTFTEEANPLDGVCLNCHEDERDEVTANEEEWLEHAYKGRISRKLMDKAEMALNEGSVFGAVPGSQRNQLCSACHDNELGEVECDREWKEHLIEGRVSQAVWEDVSRSESGTGHSTCGW